uniref:Riboflavin transporter n=1 Tax=Strigamia maritima TaxID=126957 RepID=T1IJ13_STRMM
MTNITVSRIALVHLFSIFFGIGSWVTINGVWVQLPQLVLHLPEGWALSSYFSIIVQIANIGPLTYSLIDRFIKSKLTDVIAVTLTTGIGSISCLLLSFFWNTQSYLTGQYRSVWLFVLVFLMALVDCTSSVLFLPFMATFKDKYLTSYLVGEGLSGLLPSILALIQGVGSYPECRLVNTTNSTTNESKAFYPEPRFSTGSFFILLFAMDVMSLLSFLFLNYLPFLKTEKVFHLEENENKIVAPVQQPSNTTPKDENSTLIISGLLDKRVKYYLFILQGWLCALSNGVFTAIQTYSCLPYGNNAFLLAVTLSTIANPVACCVAYFLPIKKLSIINLFVAIGTLISCYLLATAVLSPKPPLVNTTIGDILIVSD